jgi:GntR family transcriptional repressor for pyruvate dehydrogenase complex
VPTERGAVVTPIEFETLARTDLDDQIVGRIRTEILSGAYSPGDLLPPERELATQFGVNRTTLREALNRLEHLGLVERRQGIGCRVLDYRKAGSIDLLQYLLVDLDSVGFDLEAVRSVVEFGMVYRTFVARLASERATKQDIEALEAGILSAEAAFTASDVTGGQAALRDFYGDVVTASHSIVLELIRNTFVEILDANMDPEGSMFTGLAQRAISDPEAGAIHRDLFDAIEGRDSDAAEQATRRGIRELEYVFIQRTS